MKVSGLVLDFADVWARNPLLKLPSGLRRPGSDENRSSVALGMNQQLNEKGIYRTVAKGGNVVKYGNITVAWCKLKVLRKMAAKHPNISFL
jgi:hypothetical protein